MPLCRAVHVGCDRLADTLPGITYLGDGGGRVVLTPSSFPRIAFEPVEQFLELDGDEAGPRRFPLRLRRVASVLRGFFAGG